MKSISTDVRKIYVIDNTPNEDGNWLNSQWIFKLDFKVDYHALGANFGIAKAQNIGIELAIQDGNDHIILFDQDSNPPNEVVNNLYRAELALQNAGVNVGSVGPIFIDTKTNEYCKAIRHNGIMNYKIEISLIETSPSLTDYLISSGSLISISVLQKVGLMREEFFIDWVDIEWGLRAGRCGYKHFIIPTIVMRHSIGDKTVSLGKKKVNLHSDVRNYYIIRNGSNLMTDKSISLGWRTHIFLKIVYYIAFYSLTTFSKRKSSTFILLIRACFDGLTGRLGKTF